MWTRGLSFATSFRLAAIHNIFHISQLKKCVRVRTEIIDQQEILVEPDLSYTEYPLRILDKKERGTRRKVVKMYKIQWSHHTEEEATWKRKIILIDIIRVFLAPPQVYPFPT